MSVPEVFLSDGPDEELAGELELFGQFVGSWDVSVTNYDRDGSATTIPAEWHFAWALGGRAIQDVWIAPSREVRARDGSDGEWGTTIRFFDREIDAWRSTWLGPRHHVVMPFVARRVEDEIVLEGSFESGVTTRWIFSEITSQSFSWRSVESSDSGVTWRLNQRMKARRLVPERLSSIEPGANLARDATGETGLHERPIALLDAPSNLGLRPPADGVSPGVYKLAGALRDNGLLNGLHAFEGGVVVAPRYSSAWEPGAGVRNSSAIEGYSSRLADRIKRLLDDGLFPVVLGGDCSVLIGNLLALRRRGRFGLAFIDGHSDFRHPGNSEFVGSAAGEDLAIVTGRGDALASIEGRAPLVRDDDVVVLGVRDHDPWLDELRRDGIQVATAGEIRRLGPVSVTAQALTRLRSPQLLGFWIHCDFDVLDSSVMPAVDTPEPAGIDFDALSELLVPLLADDRAVGVEFTIFDPDLDEDGELAAEITRSLRRVFTSATAMEHSRGRESASSA